MGKIKEIKATCNACDHVWHYLPGERMQEAGKGMQKLGCNIMSCGLASLFMKKPEDLTSRCPKCNSKAITRETVEHDG
jgi:predicted Zn-ribbon and HTH transcriptional regulator